jgi:hypothetical protein
MSHRFSFVSVTCWSRFGINCGDEEKQQKERGSGVDDGVSADDEQVDMLGVTRDAGTSPDT